jgi:hypothetical protein
VATSGIAKNSNPLPLFACLSGRGAGLCEPSHKTFALNSDAKRIAAVNPVFKRISINENTPDFPPMTVQANPGGFKSEAPQ